MSNNDERVLSKLISQCSQAFHAHTPLIVVDTDEIELMDRLAVQSRLVDLVAQKSHIEDRHIRYYEYVGAQPRAIDLSDNFSYDPAALEELIQHGGMDCNKPPKLLVLQLINENASVYSSLIDTLRRYVQAYVRCRDNASALRSSCVLLYGDPSLLPKDLRIYSESFP